LKELANAGLKAEQDYLSKTEEEEEEQVCFLLYISILAN